MVLVSAKGNISNIKRRERGQADRGLTVSLASRNAPAHVASCTRQATK